MQVEGRYLTIELTEQVALNPGANLEHQLEELKKAGIRISMDDFGMGHGSLNYLNSADYDEVKIDGSLIKRLPDHVQTCGLIGNINEHVPHTGSQHGGGMRGDRGTGGGPSWTWMQYLPGVLL